MNPCEWNPTENRPAWDTDPNHGEATVCVGADGQWHLCAACAALPRFKRLTSRRPLTSPEPSRSTHE